jgi:hypothetical protein
VKCWEERRDQSARKRQLHKTHTHTHTHRHRGRRRNKAQHTFITQKQSGEEKKREGCGRTEEKEGKTKYIH